MKKLVIVLLLVVSGRFAYSFALNRSYTAVGSTTKSVDASNGTKSSAAVQQTDQMAILGSRVNALEKENKELRDQLKKLSSAISDLQKETKNYAKTSDVGAIKLLINWLSKSLDTLEEEFKKHTHTITTFEGTAEQIANEAKAKEKNGSVLYLYTTSNRIKKNGQPKTSTPTP